MPNKTLVSENRKNIKNKRESDTWHKKTLLCTYTVYYTIDNIDFTVHLKYFIYYFIL